MPSIVLILSVGILVSCAVGEKFKPGAPLRSQKARLYIYRPQQFRGALGRPDIHIDGKEYVALSNGGYGEFILEPGDHELEFVRSGYDRGLGLLPFRLKESGDHFVQLQVPATSNCERKMNSKDEVEEFSQKRFGRKDAIVLHHNQHSQNPCFYFVHSEVGMEEIKNTRKIYP